MPRYFPDLETFKQQAQSAEIVPVYRQLLSDHLTPVMAFEVLGRDPHAFLLESVVGGQHIARYSFIAASKILIPPTRSPTSPSSSHPASSTAIKTCRPSPAA